MLKTADGIPCPFCQTIPHEQSARPMHAAQDVLPYLDYFRDKKQEYFVCLSLDSAMRLIARRVVTIGLLDVALTHPREVFAGPIIDRAASIIVAHNHPSGECSPSQPDISATQQLVAAGLLLGMPVRDHIIVTAKGCYSFRHNHLI
ncbi:MAG TPA: JAB domain-containing protein [Candidatus Saccharimonadia bacterium]|nr:JAB domain-containing protein [Candidatus Saccharimonadia bacterium]